MNTEPETSIVHPSVAQLTKTGKSRREIVQAPLAQDLKSAFSIVQPPVAQLSWKHHLVLLNKLDTPADRLWYAAKAVEYGWSNNVLAMQIESGLHTRQGRAEQSQISRRHCLPHSPI